MGGRALSEPGKVVVVTGASSGLGASIAREAARKGHALVLTARRADRLEALAAEIEALGATALVVPAALDAADSPARIVEATIARFGRLDVLINNAGFGLPTLFGDSEPDEIRRQLDVNLVAPVLLTRVALPHLIAAQGVVINVGSAITAIPNSALGAYGTSKAGLAYFSSALLRELRHQGVRVCLVEPGPVKTEFFEAVTQLGPAPGTYHPMLDAPSAWMSADVEVVARRIARLIEHPQRRLSALKRFVWPWRLLGTLFRLWPWLGDVAVSKVVQHYDGVDPRTMDQRGKTRDNATPH